MVCMPTAYEMLVSWRLSAKQMSFLWPSGALVLITWARMWTWATVTACTPCGLAVRSPAPPMQNDVELHDGQAEIPHPNAMTKASFAFVTRTHGRASSKGVPVRGPALPTEPSPRPFR